MQYVAHVALKKNLASLTYLLYSVQQYQWLNLCAIPLLFPCTLIIYHIDKDIFIFTSITDLTAFV